MDKYQVTYDLAKKHNEFGDYDIGVYKADSIKLCRYIDELRKQVKNTVDLGSVSQQRELFAAMIDKMKESDWIECDNGFAERVFDRLSSK